MGVVKRAGKRVEFTLRSVKNVCRAYVERRNWQYLCIHKRTLTKLPPFLALPLLCGHAKGKLSCPDELTIVLIHNYEQEPIAERSLRYVGIENFVVLRLKPTRSWSNTRKFTELRRFLESGECRTEYVMFLDADDVVLRDGPERAIALLAQEDCELLLSGTSFEAGYECMPDVKRWADRVASGHDSNDRYINSGVYIGRTSFLREVLDAAKDFITERDFTREEYRSARRDGTLCDRLPEFPKGIGSDQVILRYLHPRFYPRMKIDYEARLALR